MPALLHKAETGAPAPLPRGPAQTADATDPGSPTAPLGVIRERAHL